MAKKQCARARELILSSRFPTFFDTPRATIAGLWTACAVIDAEAELGRCVVLAPSQVECRPGVFSGIHTAGSLRTFSCVECMGSTQRRVMGQCHPLARACCRPLRSEERHRVRLSKAGTAPPNIGPFGAAHG